MLTYLFITSIGITLLSLFYVIFLRKETFFQLNRITILVGLVISIVFPALDMLNQEQKAIITETVPVITLPTLNISGSGEIVSINLSQWSDTEIALFIYGFMVFILMAKFLISNALLIRFISKNKTEKLGKISLVFTYGKYPTFAYLKYIFWDNSKELDQQEQALILKHEETHIKELHSLDIFMMELLKIIFWFHPAIYLIDAALRTQHEYLADQKANQMTNDASYSQLMIRSLFEDLSLNVGHGFQFSTVKSRIKMLKKERTTQWKRVVSLFTFLTLITSIAFLQACVNDELDAADPRLQEATTENVYGYGIGDKTYWDINNSISLDDDINKNNIAQVKVFKEEGLPQIFNDKVKSSIIIFFRSDLSDNLNDKIKKLPSSNHQFVDNPLHVNRPKIHSLPLADQIKGDNEEVYELVQNPAGYPGGMNAFYQLVGDYLKYPQEAREKGLEGKVYLQFIVNKEGNGEDFKIVKGVDPILDNEVLRIAPAVIHGWVPANDKGEIVKQRMVLPINFKL